MMKEVRESMDRASDMGMLPQDADYPFAELIICMGKNYLLPSIRLFIFFQVSYLFCLWSLLCTSFLVVMDMAMVLVLL